MTEQKLRRRYVYIGDEDWGWLKTQAGLDATISSVVRSLIADARQTPQDPGTEPVLSGTGVSPDETRTDLRTA